MDQLKLLLKEEGINFTDATFNTEDGIRGLGEQPFVSKSLLVNSARIIIRYFIGRVQYGILQDVFVTNLIMICSQAVWHVMHTAIGKYFNVNIDQATSLKQEGAVWLHIM